MLEIISNNQRKHFGLQEIAPTWKEIKVESENFNGFEVVIYVDKNTIKKCIICGQKKYKEMQMNTLLTENLDAIVVNEENKKTSSLDSIINKTGDGVTISFDAPNITIYSEATKKFFYTNHFEEKENLNTIDDFKNWVINWCNESTEQDIDDAAKFAEDTTKKHIKFNEGDVFRVKLSRHIYGYGRILINYVKMRKNGEDFWDIIMGTPVVASLYHIVTDNKNISVEDLKNLKSFPSEIIMDNNIYYGEYEIIGNIPVDYEKEDFPIMYGKELTGKKITHYQKGKTHLVLENTMPLYNNFKFNGISFNIGCKLSVMKECIEANSNAPYYEKGPFHTKGDLRNPSNADKLKEVLKQFNLA